MPRVVNRAPKTPRKIRDIRPKRQLRRLSPEKKECNEAGDGWYTSSNDGVGEGSPRQLRGAAVKRFGRRPGPTFSRDSEHDHVEDESHTRRGGIFAALKLLYQRIRQTPRQKRRKRFFWGIILITALRSIWKVDLDPYTLNEDKISGGTNSRKTVNLRSIDDEFSSLKGDSDDIYTSSSKFGEPKPKVDLGSYGVSGVENNLLGGDALGKSDPSQTSKSHSLSLFPEQRSRSMSESLGLGQSNSFASNTYDSMTSHLSGWQSEIALENPQAVQTNTLYKETSLGAQQWQSDSLDNGSFQGLRGQSPFDSIQSVSGGAYDSGASSNNIQPYKKLPLPGGGGIIGSGMDKYDAYSPAKNQASMGNFQASGNGDRANSGLSMNRDTALLNAGLQAPGSNPQSARIGHSGLSMSKDLPSSHQQSAGIAMTGSYYDGSGIGISVEKESTFEGFQSAAGGDSRGGLSMSKDRSFPSQSDINYPMENIEDKRQLPMSMHGYATGLDCADHGGPYLESEYSEVIYWRDVPSDLSFTSPYYNPRAQEASKSFWKTKYLTFEMDDSGWNNMRLGLEIVMLLAHSMGRTLVLPPKRQLAHGLRDTKGKKVVSFSDFYDIEDIGARQSGLNIVSMEQFLEREALNGHLKSSSNDESIYPPNNQIKWDNQHLDPLWKYIRNVTSTFPWNPKECVLAFPDAGTDGQHLFEMIGEILVGKDGRPYPHWSEFQGRPVNVDAPAKERLREMLGGRRKICMYDKKLHEDNQVVHFRADQAGGTRLITQFNAFLWYEDWRQDLWSKRFIRDHLRYNDEVMCLSARVIAALRKHARKSSPTNTNGHYDAIHIRRGDFRQQFPMTEMSSTEILAELQNNIIPGSTLFIATNERDLTFFAPLQQVYDVKFLGDFASLISDVNPNFFPLIEQIVASRGRVFFGTFFSTFSAYITRLRGYYSVKEAHEGHMVGALQNTYFLPADWKKEMSLYQAIHKPLFGRDFPSAWRDIDRLYVGQ